MYPSPSNSITTLHNLPISKAHNYYNVDYYTFRHVVSVCRAVEIRDYPDSFSKKVETPQLNYNKNLSNYIPDYAFKKNDD